MIPAATQAGSGIPVYKPHEEKMFQEPSYCLAVCVLASGSKGNAIYISGGTTTILIDAGLSGIEIERRLRAQNLEPQKIDAIVVSHEHDDHIQGVGILARRFQLPVYITPRTFDAAAARLGAIDRLRFFECGSSFSIDSLTLHPFCTSHDAVDPAGFTVSRDGRKIGVATDLGIETAVVREHLKACDVIILEANHDPSLLADGPYPWPLKQRIKGRTGHLSNEATAKLLREVRHKNLKHVILAHLSETNNHPQQALDAVGRVLNHQNLCFTVAAQDVSTNIIVLA